MVDSCKTAMPEEPPNVRPKHPGLWAFLVRERAVLLLLATTFGLIGWQRFGMERSIHLAPDSPGIRVLAGSDASDGGKSVCRLETESDRWRLLYDVQSGGSWAYCGFVFQFLGEDGRPGLDLDRFDTLVVNLGGMRGSNSSFQVQMKSMDPHLPGSDSPRPLKYHNMILMPEGAGDSRNAMPLDYFVIPPWWVARTRTPMRNLNPTRSDVREIEIMTSADIIRLGSGVLEVRSLEFHGKWIEKETLLRIILGVWLFYVVGGAVLRVFRSFRQLRGQTDRLKELAEHDPLTRLHNRRGLENHLNSLASRSIDPANPVMGVMMVDLDHFKTVNDTLGHDAGDEILRRLAQLIQEEMRPNNLAARWGGEEFILLLPGIPVARLLPAAEKVRARVESELQYKDHRITASIGIAHGRVEEFEALAKRADEALYRAKEAGRNRVEVA